MVITSFIYPPSPEILQWLAAGQLVNRLQRTVRLWVLLNKLFGSETNWAVELPHTFSYPELRSLLFAANHPSSDKKSAKQLKSECSDRTCICHQTLFSYIFAPGTYQIEAEWRSQLIHQIGLSPTELERQMQQCPFATVHRSIRHDLRYLGKMGWLQQLSSGRYQCHSPREWPIPPFQTSAGFADHISITYLSKPQSWELMRVLESISFVQPSLELIVNSLWEQLSSMTPSLQPPEAEPAQRIFIHLDYILSPEMQDRVDTYQEQVEQLWHRPPGGIVQFEYWVNESQKVQVIVYPVCLHYVRRAKYLSAYGFDPTGQLAWHNYRLDRIASDRLTVLAWGDPRIPKPLKEMWHTGQLPTPDRIQSELELAWGFNFYLKRELLIMRFPPAFARWYVDNTFRHPTFKPIAYEQIPALIHQQVPDLQERQQLLKILKNRKPMDNYYQAWIRSGDINVMMRLRDWRPNGEVIAPLSIRQCLMEEAAQELAHYQFH
ncbi:MAG: hypothetical protein NVS2B14_08200 [Chamaesiphon sp.]